MDLVSPAPVSIHTNHVYLKALELLDPAIMNFVKTQKICEISNNVTAKMLSVNEAHLPTTPLKIQVILLSQNKQVGELLILDRQTLLWRCCSE